MINDIWDKEALLFLKLSNQYEVRMLMVGGGAVNFHGYQRHSADVDFWIDTSEENLARLVLVLKEMGYKIDDFHHDHHFHRGHPRQHPRHVS